MVINSHETNINSEKNRRGELCGTDLRFLDRPVRPLAVPGRDFVKRLPPPPVFQGALVFLFICNPREAGQNAKLWGSREYRGWS